MRLLALTLCAATSLGLAAGTSRVARADTPIPASAAEARRQAKILFQQGAEAFTRADYETAVACWTRSYDLSHEPIILQQLALAYGHLGKAHEERDSLRKWREVAPIEERPIIDQQLANLDARIAKQDATDRQRAMTEAQLKAQLDLERQRAAAGGGPPFSIAGLIISSVGLAAVISGLSVDGAAAAKRPDATKVCKTSNGSQLCLSSAEGDIGTSNRMAIAGDVTWIAGAAAVAAGVVVFIVDRPRASVVVQRRVGFYVTPYASPKEGGVVVGGSF